MHGIGVRWIWRRRAFSNYRDVLQDTKWLVHQRRAKASAPISHKMYPVVLDPIGEELFARWGAFAVGWCVFQQTTSRTFWIVSVWLAIQMLWVFGHEIQKTPLSPQGLGCRVTIPSRCVAAVVYSGVWWNMWWDVHRGLRTGRWQASIEATMTTCAIHIAWNALTLSDRPSARRYQQWINPAEKKRSIR